MRANLSSHGQKRIDRDESCAMKHTGELMSVSVCALYSAKQLIQTNPSLRWPYFPVVGLRALPGTVGTVDRSWRQAPRERSRSSPSAEQPSSSPAGKAQKVGKVQGEASGFFGLIEPETGGWHLAKIVHGTWNHAPFF